MKLILSIFVLTIVSCLALIQEQEPEYIEPPRPYNFNIRAGRFPGHIDRQHIESGDGSGVVRGSYSYIGPRQQIRTVDYIADANGFHPIVHNPVLDTPAVAHAKLQHASLYEQIAAEHAAIAQQRAALHVNEHEQ